MDLSKFAFSQNFYVTNAIKENYLLWYLAKLKKEGPESGVIKFVKLVNSILSDFLINEAVI